MKVISKIFLVALLLSLIFSCSAVFAEENMTFEQSSIQNVSIETDNQENNVIIGDEILKDDEEILKAEDYADSSSAMDDDNFQLDDDGALGVDDDVALNAGSSHNVEGNDFSSIQNALNYLDVVDVEDSYFTGQYFPTKVGLPCYPPSS